MSLVLIVNLVTYFLIEKFKFISFSNAFENYIVNSLDVYSMQCAYLTTKKYVKKIVYWSEILDDLLKNETELHKMSRVCTKYM